MNPEHFRVVIYARRTLVAVVGADTLDRLRTSLAQVGAQPLGPSAWTCEGDVTVEPLALTVGELEKDEAVYLFGGGAERSEFGVLTAPKTDGGIIVTA